MKIKNIGTAAKYTVIALAGCAVAAVAAENLLPGDKKDVPLLTATFSSSSAHSVNGTDPSTRTVPTSVSSSLTAQSSTSVTSPETSEAPEPASESEPTVDEPDSPPQYEPITEEPTYEPEPSSETSEGFTDETSEPIPDSSSEITSSTSGSSSSTEPPISSSEPPVISEPPEFVIVNINTATVDELTQLDGIGEEKALAIISFREKFGGFTSIYEVRDVDGIGDATFEKIRDFIVI